MSNLRFTKMHGLGNDFVVLDGRAAPIELSAAQVRAIADRRAGVGCDQLITLVPAAGADVFMRIHNADGGEVEACGNGARCVGRLLGDETGAEHIHIATGSGLVVTTAEDDGSVTVDMGPARLDWVDIPLARETDTLHLDLARGPLSDPVAVNIGNPHAVFFVDDAEAIAIDELGPGLEIDPLFPERANIEVAQVIDSSTIRMRVWERGVGITKACGTGACATAVAASRRGLTGRAARVRLDGGDLDITWRDDGHVLMRGPTATSFTGEIDAALLA